MLWSSYQRRLLRHEIKPEKVFISQQVTILGVWVDIVQLTRTVTQKLNYRSGKNQG